MSLNWNIEDVRDHEEVAIRHNPGANDNDHLTTEELVQSLITQAVVFRTVSVGINQITEENVEEIATRSKMWERLNGTTLWIDHEDYSLSLEDFARRVGLRTNADKMTAGQFDKRMAVRLREAGRHSMLFDKGREKATA